MPEPDRIGPYEVISLLGAGGMGEVYKAHDPRLNRTVAIKVLPQRNADDADRRSRLLREARTASALNHPNIVTIHDIISEPGRDSIVMEYVEGRTLEQAIGAKGLPFPETVQYAIQIAGALAAAHAAGIVHRDLKPANVMITSGGLKVLDFGLAKTQMVGAESQTVSMTMEGVIAGTLAYMSPEQAEGRNVDARSDIFAFGSVLYEMLAGRQAFNGVSTLSIITAILRDHPAPLPEAPAELQSLIERCLRKDPVRRLHSMHDVRILLEEFRDAPAPPPTSPPSAQRRRILLPAGVAALVAGAALALLLWRPVSPDLSGYRLTPFATEAGAEDSPAWSPDGRSLAYEFEVDGVRQIYTRSLDAPYGTRITNAAAACSLPFWSHDGNRIYYVSQRQLWSISPAGGIPQIVQRDLATATISPDGRTLFFVRGTAGDGRLWLASPPDAEPHLYTQPPFSSNRALIAAPAFSPDGSTVALFTSKEAAATEPELWLIPFPQGVPVRAPVHGQLRTQGGSYRISWMPDNRHIVLAESGRLYMLDIRRGDLHAIMPSTVAESQPAVSPDGHRIAFASGDLDFDIVEIALDGESVRSVLATSMKETAPAWSPSGAQYAYSTNGNGHWQIWLRNAREEGATPLASHDASQTIYDIENLKFSPDGRRIAYDLYGARHSVAISNLAGGAPMILDPQNPDNHGPSWSPDGNWIAYRRVVDGKWELVKRSVGGGESIHLDDTGEGGRPTAWSPSGEWICHLLPGSGLRLVSQNGARRLDIQSGGASAFGSQDGARRLEIQSGGTAAFGFSTDSRTLYAVRANSSRHWELAAFPLPAGAPAKIMPLDLPGGAAVSGFTMNPDGKSFLTAVGKARLDIWLLEGFAQP